MSLTNSTISGDINAAFHLHEAGADRAHRLRRGIRILDQQHEKRIAALFAEPAGWHSAVLKLTEQHIVLLTATRGSGRRTTAIRLLGIGADLNRPIHELSAAPDDAHEELVYSEEVAEKDRLLLDLSMGDYANPIPVDLAALTDAVHQRSAFLVVVLPHGAERLVPPHLAPFIVQVGRPDGSVVLRRHLAVRDISDPPPEPMRQELVKILDYGAMSEIADLARLVADARERSGPSTAPEKWFDEALAAHGARTAEVSAKIAGQSARSRAMLLTAALLENFPADAVFDAEQLLLEAVDFKPSHDFEEPDLRTRFDEIGVNVAENDCIEFRLLNYASVVRRHFWTNFPNLRDGFRDWVIACGRKSWWRAGHAEMVTRFVDACLWADRPTDVIYAIEAWTSNSPDRSLLAYSALEAGIVDVRTGWRFRQQCYAWSIQSNLGAPLAHVVIAACLQTIALNHPQQAIVRLHHFTHNHNHGVATMAASALLRLADDHRLRRRILDRLVSRDLSLFT